MDNVLKRIYNREFAGLTSCHESIKRLFNRDLVKIERRQQCVVCWKLRGKDTKC